MSNQQKLSRWSLFLLNAPAWAAVVLSLLVICELLREFSMPQAAKSAFCSPEIAWGYVAVAMIGIRACQLFVSWVHQHWLLMETNPHRSRVPFWPWLIVLPLLTQLALHHEGPLKSRFCISRPFMDRLANAALENPANADRLGGRFAGAYYFHRIEVVGDTVVLWFHSNYGFARVPSAKSDSVWNRTGPNQSDHEPFPENNGAVADRLADHWFVVYDHYWSVKRGWSRLEQGRKLIAQQHTDGSCHNFLAVPMDPHGAKYSNAPGSPQGT